MIVLTGQMRPRLVSRDGRDDCVDGSDETTPCFKSWRCNGTLQCINQPCHEEGQTKCQPTVEKKEGRYEPPKTYKMYYCAEEDQCKLEGVPCDGKCVVDIKTFRKSDPIKPENQFACHDGSKCVDWKTSYCNGRRECPDGSDEICECQGKTDCKDRIKVTETIHEKYICKSGNG